MSRYRKTRPHDGLMAGVGGMGVSDGGLRTKAVSTRHTVSSFISAIKRWFRLKWMQCRYPLKRFDYKTCTQYLEVTIGSDREDGLYAHPKSNITTGGFDAPILTRDTLNEAIKLLRHAPKPIIIDKSKFRILPPELRYSIDPIKDPLMFIGAIS